MARSPSAWCAGASPGGPGLRRTGAGGQEGQFTFKDLRFNRAFVNDAQGNALYVNQAAGQTGRIQNGPGGYLGGWVGDSLDPGHIQRQLVANGEVLGRYGDAPDRINNPTRPDAAPKYVHTTDFQLEAQVLNLKGASVDPVSYTVVGGETLRDVARNVLGDASLWWRIADANALAVSADAPLTAGQTLTVPKLALNANSAETFQPYDPSKITGSLEPTLPMPAQGDKCGGMGKIIMAVVAVAVAAVTQQWWLANVAEISGGVGAAVSQGAYGALAASGAVGGAAGSIASQAVGVAIGAQEGFSWKGVAMGALAGGISSGLAGTQLLGGSSWQMTAVRMATANALTQGVAVATGLQKSFDWRGVAAAAVGGGVGAAVNGALGGYTLPEGMAGPQIPAAFSGLGEFGGGLARGMLSGMAAGTAAAIARGGKVAIQQVATDAFGNALGGALLDYANAPTPSAATSMGRPASIGANGEQRFGVMDLEPDPISQAYDYSQRNPNSGIRFSDAVEYFGAKESAQYLPSLIPDSQLIGRGKTTEGLDYYDWDSGSRATQTLLKSVQGVPLPAWEDTQVSALPSRESTRSYYQDIEDNASHAAMAVTARVARLAAEGFHDNIDSFNSFVHLAQDDKARRMAMAQGLYAIANPGETAKSAAIGAANYVRTLSFEKAGEDGLRFLSGAALSAGVGKGASMVGGLASDALVLDRVAGKVGDAENLASVMSRPVPRIDVSESFSKIPRRDGGFDFEFGDPTTHGLFATVSKNGVLSMDIRSSKALAIEKGSGTDLAASLMNRLEREGIEVTRFEAQWMKGSKEVSANYWYYNRQKYSVGELDAARGTWTGKFFAKYGFEIVSPPTIVNTPIKTYVATFTKIKP